MRKFDHGKGHFEFVGVPTENLQLLDRLEVCRWLLLQDSTLSYLRPSPFKHFMLQNNYSSNSLLILEKICIGTRMSALKAIDKGHQRTPPVESG